MKLPIIPSLSGEGPAILCPHCQASALAAHAERLTKCTTKRPTRPRRMSDYLTRRNGTLDLLPSDLRPMVRGLILNRVRLTGDATSFFRALRTLESIVGVQVRAVIPLMKRVEIIEEDSLRIRSYRDVGDIEGAISAEADELRKCVDMTNLLSLFAS